MYLSFSLILMELPDDDPIVEPKLAALFNNKSPFVVSDEFSYIYCENNIQGDSVSRGPKLLEKRFQVCLDVKGDHFQH
jgi:hypothetical protein